MATINTQGTVRARCPGCKGALSSFEWRTANAQHGVTIAPYRDYQKGEGQAEYRLFRCAGCGMGGLGAVACAQTQYPNGIWDLLWFHPEVKERLPLPKNVPDGIETEFREGETCLESGALRASAAMFRSVLDKTLRANGYKEKKGTTLEQQIDMAAEDGVITQARRRRAHDEIRVLGNDVLHDEWQAIPEEDVEAARYYAQRILEDFYDDRESVLKQLYDAKRLDPPAAA